MLTLAIQNKAKNKEDERHQFKLFKSIILVIIGIMGIVLGSELVVNNDSSIATNLKLSEKIISLTIIDFGTSLPELMTTIVSSKK